MSTEDQEKLVGKLFLEHRELKQQVDMLTTRLRQVGRNLLTISQQLTDEQFDVAETNLSLFRDDVVDLSALAALVKEHRSTKDRMQRCASDLANLKW
jgi:hypothetical protein